MTPLVSLWLPILLSAVGVFLLSSVLHMFTGWHKSDYLKVPNEDRVMDTLRPLGIPPGDYMMPRPESTRQMRSPAFAEKFKRGPVMMFTVMPGGSMAMGKQLTQWFLFSVVVGIFAPADSALPATSAAKIPTTTDRKSTRLNSSHDQISYAVFCLKKKNTNIIQSALS